MRSEQRDEIRKACGDGSIDSGAKTLVLRGDAVDAFSRFLRREGLDGIRSLTVEEAPGARKVGPLLERFLGQLTELNMAGVRLPRRFALIDSDQSEPQVHAHAQLRSLTLNHIFHSSLNDDFPRQRDLFFMRLQEAYPRLTQLTVSDSALLEPEGEDPVLGHWKCESIQALNLSSCQMSIPSFDYLAGWELPALVELDLSRLRLVDWDNSGQEVPNASYLIANVVASLQDGHFKQLERLIVRDCQIVAADLSPLLAPVKGGTGHPRLESLDLRGNAVDEGVGQRLRASPAFPALQTVLLDPVETSAGVEVVAPGAALPTTEPEPGPEQEQVQVQVPGSGGNAAPGRRAPVPLERLLDAVRPVQYLAEPKAIDIRGGPVVLRSSRPSFGTLADLEWQALCAGANRLEPDDEQRSALEAAANKLGDGVRKAPEAWLRKVADGAPPPAWSLCRSVPDTLPIPDPQQLGHITTLQVTDFDAATSYVLPKLTKIEGSAPLATHQVPPLFKAHRKLRELSAEVTEHDVTELARVKATARLQGLSLWNEWQEYDGRLAYLLDSGLSKLRSLELHAILHKKALASLTKKGAFAQLRHLRVHSVAGAAQGKSLRNLSARFPKLDSLDLRDFNEMTDGPGSLPKSLKQLSVCASHDYDFQNLTTPRTAVRLRRFHVSGTLQPEDIGGLARWPCLANVEELSLEVNTHTGARHVDLFRALTSLPGKKLRHLNLCLWSLDDDECAALAELLRGLGRLESLKVRSSEATATKTGVMPLVEATTGLKSIQVDFPAFWLGFATDLNFPNLVTALFNLGYWPPERAEPVTVEQAHTLNAGRLPQLRHLIVHEGELGPKAAGVIAGSDLPTLALGFDGTPQPVDSLTALAQSAGLPNLCHLHLRETDADPDTFADLIAAGVRVDT